MTVVPSPIINAELQNFLLQKLSQIIVHTSFLLVWLTFKNTLMELDSMKANHKNRKIDSKFGHLIL